MDGTGASGGALKYMIRIDARMVRRIEYGPGRAKDGG